MSKRAKKVPVQVQLHEETYAVVAEFCRRVGEPFSSFVDLYVQQMAGYIQQLGFDKGGRVTRIDMLRLVLYGMGEFGAAITEALKRKPAPKEKQVSLPLGGTV